MLKTLDELEKAVERLVERTLTGKAQRPSPGDAEAPGNEAVPGPVGTGEKPGSDEAADLIRRAIKRLKSL